MKFFGLLNSFTVILLLNNLSCSDSDNEPPKKKLKVESSDEESSNLDDESSDLDINNEWHDLLTNENFTSFCDSMNKLVEENHKELRENEKTLNDELLKETKSLMDKSLIPFKVNCRDDVLSYLKENFDVNADFESLYKKKLSSKDNMGHLKLFNEKATEFECMSHLLSTLLNFIDTNENKNLSELYIMQEELKLMKAKIKNLKELFNDYSNLMNENFKNYSVDLNYFTLIKKIKEMRETFPEENDFNFAEIRGVILLKHAIYKYFADFNDYVQDEKSLSFLIFDSMDRIFFDFQAFNEWKNNLIRNCDLG